MLTYPDIKPVADELLARWEKMDRRMRDPHYPQDVYDLAREYLNDLLRAGHSEEFVRSLKPAEVIDLYQGLDTA